MINSIWNSIISFLIGTHQRPPLFMTFMHPSPLLKYSLVLGLLLIFTFEAVGQSRIEILQSDEAEAVQTSEGLLRKLRGNVILRTNDVQIQADSAWHYVDRRQIHGFGNLRVETRSEIILADKIIYYVDDEISTLFGGVIIESESATIYSTSAIYSFLTEIALFRDPVWMQDADGFLKADNGIYFNQADSAVFRGNVQLADSTQYIEADSMFVNRSSKRYELYGNVYLQDDENNSRLTGDYVEADSTGRRFIRGNAVLQRADPESADTTWLRAAQILVTKSDNNSITEAFGGVEIREVRYASISDSLYYNEALELFRLRGGRPTVWYERTQLSGLEIDIQLLDEKIQRLTATSEPFVAQQDSVTMRINQMLGDSLVIHFADEAITRIDVIENAELLLHYNDEQNNPDGALNLRASGINILFEDAEVADMTAHGGVEGQAFEESEELIDKKLDRFNWSPDARPMRPEKELLPRRPELARTPPFTRLR